MTEHGLWNWTFSTLVSLPELVVTGLIGLWAMAGLWRRPAVSWRVLIGLLVGISPRGIGYVLPMLTGLTGVNPSSLMISISLIVTLASFAGWAIAASAFFVEEEPTTTDDTRATPGA